MELTQIQSKVKLLFEKIREEGYVMNNYYADGLIDKLANGTEPETVNLKSLSVIPDLITNALESIDKYDTTVKVFVVRLLAIASRRELHFTKIFTKRGTEISKIFKDLNSPTMNKSLRVACMEVALAIIPHDSGISWLLETGVWKEILSLCNEKQTVFVVRQTYKFSSTFLWRLNDLGEESNIRLVLNHVFQPTKEIDFMNMNTISSEEEELFIQTLEPMLHIVLSVITEKNRIAKSNNLIEIIIKEYSLTQYMYIMFDRLRSEKITLLILRVIFWMILAKLFLIKPPSQEMEYSCEYFIELAAMYFNTIKVLCQRRAASMTLDFCAASTSTWLTFCKDANIKYDGNTKKLQNQLLFMCLVPTLVYIKEIGKSCCNESTKDRITEYITKLLNDNCEHTTRAAYAVRDLTLQLDALDITVQSVKRLTCLNNLLNNEQANLVFQALFYILMEYDPTSAKGESDPNCVDSHDKDLVISYVLDTVLYLVKNHDINWQESLEVLCLYRVVYNILMRPNLSCKFIVTALNLITVTVKKFLPPNLSLLMEAKPGSSMHELGKLIYVKMHDRNWEIRDSALELLWVCTDISFIKFPPFQKQLLENNLINVAATLAFNDFDSYVQASALKCVGAATKVTALWDLLTSQYPNIQNRLISILRNNQEGIVRKEASAVLIQVYQNIKLSSQFKLTLYEHMVSSALTDFHWEVQLSALKFWRMVIMTLLSGQGMLDGTFPPVTFSKETRKIVTLNEAEIQKRLLRILDELASIGCLTVLVKLLNEESEVDILDATLNISIDLLNMLNQYKVPDLIKLNENEVGTVEELLCNIKAEDDGATTSKEENKTEAPRSDKVIEGILNEDDMNLLSDIYKRHMNLETVKPNDKKCTPWIKLLKRASPYLFVKHMMTNDFKSVVEQKKRWKEGIRSLSSLLDDVLGIYEINEDANTLDCY